MHKPIIAFLAFAFLASPLHAEEQKPGSAAAAGAIQGTAKGVEGNNLWSPNATKSANKNSDQVRSLLMKPTKPKTSTSGSPRQQGRQ